MPPSTKNIGIANNSLHLSTVIQYNNIIVIGPNLPFSFDTVDLEDMLELLLTSMAGCSEKTA